MAQIEGIPEETLFETFLLLEHDRQSLVNLSYVSRRFWQTARQVLFRHITIDEHGSSSQRDSGRLNLFHRSLKDAPELGNCVQSWGPINVKFRLTNFNSSTDNERDIIADLSSLFVSRITANLLECCTNLKRIRLVQMETYRETTSMVNISEVSNLDKVIDACVNTDHPEIWFAAMTLPKIQHLSGHFGAFAGRKFHQTHRSPIRTLEIINADTAFSMEELSQILLGCPRLTKLTCKGKLNVSYDDEPTWSSRFNTGGLIEGLESIQNTLEVLEIFITHKGVYGYHVESMDLTGFTHLRHLSISAMVFFGSEALYHGDFDKSIRLIHRLPSCLESLKVSFSSAMMLHDFGNGGILQFQPATEQRPLKHDWILHFSREKQIRIPNLTLVQLEDDLELGAGDSLIRWDPPQEIRSAFEAAGIQLEIRVFDSINAHRAVSGCFSPVSPGSDHLSSNWDNGYSPYSPYSPNYAPDSPYYPPTSPSYNPVTPSPPVELREVE
ncbi:hypothetical protein B0J11DRAFT_535074 [Dendryphion nanum]|uniref:F-box domain-containing protein n=1 Tax=Dendryphion nanum TaxID=256645 RepID=A0A9P9DK39_9PLEO|nr:hypothetical protein B0J11DRAFT_535074 [Dendryphion nanum]